MVLAHRERITPRLTQRDLSRLRVASGRPAPLSGPGTYARHNAVDMPALLPDGTPDQASVPSAIGGVPETPDQRRTLLGSSAAAIRSAAGPGESSGDSGQEGDA